MKTEKEQVQQALETLRNSNMDYRNDSIYGAAILLSSYFDENLSVAEAVNEFMQNTDLEIKADVVQE